MLRPRFAGLLLLFFFPVGEAETLQRIFSDFYGYSFHLVFVRLDLAQNLAHFALVQVSKNSEVDRVAAALDTFLLNDRRKLTNTGSPGVFAVGASVPDLGLDPVDLRALWVYHSLDLGVVERLRVCEFEFVGLNARCDQTLFQLDLE